jgi:hypothetical protein
MDCDKPSARVTGGSYDNKITCLKNHINSLIVKTDKDYQGPKILNSRKKLEACAEGWEIIEMFIWYE